VTSSRLETRLLTYCQLVSSLRRTHTRTAGVMDAKWLLSSERQEHVLDHVAVGAMNAKWLLSRAGESGAVAMDAKRLLGRAGKSGQSCCVARASPGRVMPDPYSTSTLAHQRIFIVEDVQH